MEDIKDKAYDDELNKSEEEIGETLKRRKSVKQVKEELENELKEMPLFMKRKRLKNKKLMKK